MVDSLKINQHEFLMIITEAWILNYAWSSLSSLKTLVYLYVRNCYVTAITTNEIYKVSLCGLVTDYLLQDLIDSIITI